MSSFPNPRPLYSADFSRPIRDPKYLAWIRTLPCSVHGCPSKHSEAAHTGGRGLSQKASDRDAIPLCSAHHKEYHRLGRKKFERTYRLDIALLIQKLNEKPVVRVMAGRFVAQLAGEEYDLGTVRKPVGQAMSHAIAIGRERPLNVRL